MRFYERRKRFSEVITKELMPDRQFAEKAKKEFLISFDMKQSLRPAGAVFLSGAGASGPRKFVWRSAGVIAAACGVLIAASAFADVANVPPTNPLYPLKRLAEGTTLAFSSAAEKPALQLAFATRRVEEIKAIVASPNAVAYGPVVDGLTKDLDGEVSSSGVGTESSDVKGAPLATFCGAIGATSSVEAEGSRSLLGVLAANPVLQMRVLTACGVASSSVTGTDSLSASSHLSPGLFHGEGSLNDENKNSGHGASGNDRGDRGNDEGVSTTISSTANTPLPALEAIPSLLPHDEPSSSVSSTSAPASGPREGTSSSEGSDDAVSGSASVGVTVPATIVTPPVSAGAGTGAAVSIPSLPL